MKRIAIQGAKGSFHDITAHRYFSGEDIEVIYCARFEDIFSMIKKDDSIIGLMAIENTIAGSLLQNHELLRESDTQIIGEARLHISHSIMCLPEDDWEDITEVSSHPIALMSAEDIFENKLHGHAAICGKDVAAMYGLKILQEGIETNKHNSTRFLILANRWHADELRKNDICNKSSFVFTLPHTEGSLSQVLSILSYYKMNLTKIQSLPIIGREWEYQFYIDVVYEDRLRYRQAVDAITPLIKELKILGEYAESKNDL